MPGSSQRLLVLVLGLLALSLGMPLLPRAFFGLQGPDERIDIVQLKRNIADNAKHPAIFLAGGSNVLTGLRATLIGDALQRPVYNLGLPGEEGDYRHVFALLETTTRAGDTVVYASRGFHMDPPFAEQGSLSQTRYTGSGLSLPARSMLHLAIPELATSRWERAGNFDAAGDFIPCLVHPLNLAAQPFQASIAHRGRFLRDVVEFSARMKKRDVQMLWVAPDLLVRESDLPLWIGRYDDTQAVLKKAGVRWLRLAPADVFITQPSAFCDTPLHPTEKRAIAKSHLLVQQLRALQ